MQVARGSIQFNGEQLKSGDGARLRDEKTLHIGAAKDAEVLVFDVRPNQLTQKP